MMQVAEWQRRRNQLNHNELNNMFIMALAGQVSFLAGGAEDLIKTRVFIDEQLPQWDSIRDRMKTLLQDFEEGMSPRQLLDRPPLDRCPSRTRAWLAPLVDALWRVRYPIEQWLSEAESKLEAADVVYVELSQKIKACNGKPCLRTFGMIGGDIERLAAACRTLSDAVHNFPHEVLVT